jgi:hypothetical protein
MTDCYVRYLTMVLVTFRCLKITLSFITHRYKLNLHLSVSRKRNIKTLYAIKLRQFL